MEDRWWRRRVACAQAQAVAGIQFRLYSSMLPQSEKDVCEDLALLTKSYKRFDLKNVIHKIESAELSLQEKAELFSSLLRTSTSVG